MVWHKLKLSVEIDRLNRASGQGEIKYLIIDIFLNRNGIFLHYRFIRIQTQGTKAKNFIWHTLVLEEGFRLTSR